MRTQGDCHTIPEPKTLETIFQLTNTSIFGERLKAKLMKKLSNKALDPITLKGHIQIVQYFASRLFPLIHFHFLLVRNFTLIKEKLWYVMKCHKTKLQRL